MARPIRRNRPHVRKINYIKHPNGVFINQKRFGELVEREDNPKSLYKVKEYRYTGRLHQGLIEFRYGQDLKTVVPEPADYDHGYTLEGIADKLFEAQNALVIHSAIEHRSFVYINRKTTRSFVGDPNKVYSVYIRIYDNVYGNSDNRWVVLYAEEAK